MNKHVRSELEILIALIMFLDAHPEIEAAITEMAGDVDAVRSIIEDVKAAGIIQIIQTSGITKDVKAQKLQMARTVIRIAKIARPKARREKKNELLDQLDHPVSYILQCPKEIAVIRARAIEKTIKDHDTYFSNVKPADYTAMNDVIEAFDSDHAKPRYTIHYKAVAGTEAIFNLIQEGYIPRDNVVDYIEGYYEEDKPELVAEMKKDLGMVEEGVHHTGIEALCINGKPEPGAITTLEQNVVFTIVELDRKEVSDINGLATIIKFMPGTYHITFKKAGFLDKEMIVKVTRGEILHLTVEMLPN